MKLSQNWIVALAMLSLGMLSLSTTVACVDGEDGQYDSSAQALNNFQDVDTPIVDMPRGSKVVMNAQQEQDLVESGALDNGSIAHAGETIVYMNRVGGTFSPGNSNSSTNRTTLANQTVNFPAANLSDSTWAQVMSCVQGQFSQFNIIVTDVDPGGTPHYESVIGGSPQLLGMAEGVGGVSPFTSNCDMIPGSIVFTFTDVLPNDPQIICEIAAQEVAHSFGLDHQYLCSDPMTYLSGCGAKSFQNVSSACGEFSARACATANYNCGYAEQNSVELLTQRIGLKPEGVDDFAAVISAPSNGAEVSPGFVVTVDASDATLVELHIDGTLVSSLGSPPFVFDTDTNLGSGSHSIEIIATSPSGTASDTVDVNVLVNGGGGDGNGGDGNGNGGGDGGGNGEGEESDFGDTPQITGGCSTSRGGAGDAALLILLALGVLGLRRKES